MNDDFLSKCDDLFDYWSSEMLKRKREDRYTIWVGVLDVIKRFTNLRLNDRSMI